MPEAPTPPPAVLARRFLGLRTYLLALTLAALVPALAVGAAAAWQAVSGHRAAFEARLQDAARALNVALDVRIGADLAVLQAVAGAPALDPDADPSLADRLIRRTAAGMGTDIVLADPDTRAYRLHTAVPPGSPPPRVQLADAVAQVIETGRPVVSDLRISAATGRPALGPVVPVIREGRITGVLAIRLEPQALLSVLRAQILPQGAVATLIDRQGRILARTLAHEASVGQPIQDWIRAATLASGRGLAQGLNREGVPVIAAYEGLSVASGWYLVLTMPRGALVWSWARPLATLAVGGVPLLMVSLALALWLGRRLLRPVEALRLHARGVARGRAAEQPVLPPGEAIGVVEFEALRTDIEAAEAALRRRLGQLQALARASLEATAASTLEARLERITEAAREVADAHQAVVSMTRGPDWSQALNAVALTGKYGHWRGYATMPDGSGIYAWLCERGGVVRMTQAEMEAHPRWRGFGAHAPEHPPMRGWLAAALTGADGRNLGLIQVSDKADGGEFDEADEAAIAQLAQFASVTVERARAEERQALLAREVDHRAKNALAVVQAAMRLTPKSDATAYARAVEGRVGALARAQTLLAEDRWRGASLRGLLQGEMEAFLPGDGTPRVELEGPPIMLPATAAQPLAMVVHELATNAVKHGALSAPEGRVHISWSAVPGTHQTLRLRWAETGGPALPGTPERRGFGTRVLDSTVRGQLGGTLRLDWAPEGLVCEVEVPLAAGPAAPLEAEGV